MEGASHTYWVQPNHSAHLSISFISKAEIAYDSHILKIGKVSCHIVSDTLAFICKIRVPAASMHDHAVPMPYMGIKGNN